MRTEIYIECCLPADNPACSLVLFRYRGDWDADEDDGGDMFESDVAAYEEGVADIEQTFGEVLMLSFSGLFISVAL